MEGSSGSEDETEPYKLVVVVRTDLGMSSGKTAAQVGHAVHAVVDCNPTTRKAWEDDGETIVVLQVDDEKGLKDLIDVARRAGVAFSSIEDEGLTELDSGEITALAIGPDKVDQVNLITGELRLFRSSAELELEALRQRVLAAEAEAALWQSSPSPASLKSWFVLELDIDRRAGYSGDYSNVVVPDLLEKWCWEGDTSVLPFKWERAVEECCAGHVCPCALKPWDCPRFDSEGIFFLTHRSQTCGIGLAVGLGNHVGIIAGVGAHPEHRGKGLEKCLLRLCLNRHANLGNSLVYFAVDEHTPDDMKKLLADENFNLRTYH